MTNPDDDKDTRLSGFLVPNNAPGFEIVPMPHMIGCRCAGHAGRKFTNLVLESKYLLGK